MIKFENTEVVGWEAAIRGMRNPKESWNKSDSFICREGIGDCKKCPFLVDNHSLSPDECQRESEFDEKNGVLVDIEKESIKPKKKMRRDSDGNAVLDSKGKNIYDVIPGEFNNIMNEFNLY